MRCASGASAPGECVIVFRIETAIRARLARDEGGRGRVFRRGEDIDVSDPRIHRLVCVRGFGGPEAEGTWTEVASAGLCLRVAPDARAPVAIWMAVRPFVTRAHDCVIDLRCGDTPLGVLAFTAAEPGRHVLRIGLDAVPGDGGLHLALQFRAPSSPAREGISEDPRLLGLMVERLAVTAADASPPPLFEGPPILVGAPPIAAAVSDRAQRLEARREALAGRLDRVLKEMDETRQAAALAQVQAARLAAAFAGAPARGSGGR